MGGWLNYLYGQTAQKQRLEADQRKEAEAERIKKKYRKDGKLRFDKVAYQREYMRRRRAKANASPTPAP